MFEITINTDIVIGKMQTIEPTINAQFLVDFKGIDAPVSGSVITMWVYAGGDVLSSGCKGEWTDDGRVLFSPEINEDFARGYFEKRKVGEARIHFIQKGGREWVRDLQVVGSLLN